MKNLLKIICIASFLITFSACNESTSTNSSINQSDNTASTYNEISESNISNCEELLQKFQEISGTENMNLTLLFSDSTYQDNFKKLYDFDIKKLSDGGIIYSEIGTFSDEISILKPTNNDLELAVEALKARKESRQNTFSGYSPEESAKIEKARVFTAGDYAFLVISESAETIETEIRDMF